MSNPVYVSLWVAAALLAAALLSAAIARQLRLRELRRIKAGDMLQALAQHADWIASQRRATYFQGEDRETGLALEQAQHIATGWFPQLSGGVAELLVLHTRLIDFLWTQQVLRMKDPEAWLESDHDTRFMELWRYQNYALQALAEKLQRLAGIRLAAGEAEAMFTVA